MVTFIGDVQGVGFRRQAQRKAMELNITGSIQNDPDGSVSALIEGELDALFILIQFLATSFSLKDIKISFEDSPIRFESFSIR
jgi:acylphosphatase